MPWLISCSAGYQKATNTSLATTFSNAVERFQRSYAFPGITASYVLPDGTSHSAAAGWADVENGQPMTSESRMLAASIGKTFVAATMVSLAQERAIDLDAPLSTWLGQNNWFQRLPNHRSLTIRQLLSHTSGLPNHVYLPAFVETVSERWPEPGNPFTPETLVRFVLDAEALFPPGEQWAYTDTGYILIGLVIEAITGRTYYEEVNDRFLEPLGLNATSASNKRRLSGLAAGYAAADNPFDFPVKTTDENGVMFWNPALEWTGGGLISTSRDLAKWGAAIFGGQGVSEEILNTMLQSVPIGDDMPGTYYGLGISIFRSGPLSPVFGHGGWIPGYSSSLRHYAESGITIAFQVNSDRISHQSLSEIELCLARVVISSGEKTDCVP
ncbi:serine hydrolase domain-containing protein [Marinobacter sp. es.048]|uniref:serine hydrolase domain-containing protein n=1 Tax=Marinobacter sp. es.048 TaxID=1761795 RepID=UPI001C0EA285|nr:serine hydrolase domain-containing protein [Marinobacter sp. es.048]